jgi:hypothetical protein
MIRYEPRDHRRRDMPDQVTGRRNSRQDDANTACLFHDVLERSTRLLAIAI